MHCFYSAAATNSKLAILKYDNKVARSGTFGAGHFRYRMSSDFEEA